MGQRAGGRAVVMVKIRTALVLIFAAIALAGLSGCATTAAPILTPVTVEVPISTPIYCEASALSKPKLPIADLKADSAPADTIRAYAATVVLLKGAVQERDLVIAGCAAPVGTPQAPATLELGTASATGTAREAK